LSAARHEPELDEEPEPETIDEAAYQWARDHYPAVTLTREQYVEGQLEQYRRRQVGR
jgi:hypothetical protein